MADRLNEQQMEKYRENRAEGMNVPSALRNARTPVVEAIEWDDVFRDTRGSGFILHASKLTRDGFDITLQVITDDSGDTSFMGEFTDEWESGAIKLREGRSRDESQYFVPGNSYASHRKGLCNMGYSRGVASDLANEYVYRDLKTMTALRNDEWQYVGVSATVYRKGIELGSDSLWGIELWTENGRGEPFKGSPWPYIDEVARDCMDTAIKEAQKAVAELPEELKDVAQRFRNAVAQIDFSLIPGAYDSIPWAAMDAALDSE